MHRRAVLQGVLATTALGGAPIGVASASEPAMRRKLASRVLRAEGTSRLLGGMDWVSARIKNNARADHAASLRELAEFDRGEGVWRSLAARHPEGVSDPLAAEVRARRCLSARVGALSGLQREHPNAADLRDELREALDELVEFDRGEGRLRKLVERWPDDV